MTLPSWEDVAEPVETERATLAEVYHGLRREDGFGRLRAAWYAPFGVVLSWWLARSAGADR